jgi:hypothetical protein
MLSPNLSFTEKVNTIDFLKEYKCSTMPIGRMNNEGNKQNVRANTIFLLLTSDRKNTADTTRNSIELHLQLTLPVPYFLAYKPASVPTLCPF